MISEHKLKKIKDSIVNEDKLISKDYKQIYILPAKINKCTNCYSYSLGIMESSNCYVPGFTTKNEYDKSSKESFISKICEDFDNLGIKYRKFGLNDKIKLRDNEYLIQAMFVPKCKQNSYYYDFHFSRKITDELWFAKQGWENQPCFENVKVLDVVDSMEYIEITSINCVKKYYRVAYFAIEEKR